MYNTLRSHDGLRIPQVAPSGTHRRVSSDSAWPLRRADGRTWAESKGAQA